MTWEEYQNTDFYREGHPEQERRSVLDRKTDLMESYLYDLKEHESHFEDGEDLDIPDEYGYYHTYVCYTTWNGHISGLLGYGTYKQCRYMKYEYDLAHLNDEYGWAAVKCEEYADLDELDDILNAAREIDFFDICMYEEEY